MEDGVSEGEEQGKRGADERSRTPPKTADTRTEVKGEKGEVEVDPALGDDLETKKREKEEANARWRSRSPPRKKGTAKGLPRRRERN